MTQSEMVGVGPAVAPEAGVAVVDIVVPIYNEQATLERSVRRLDDFLGESFPYSYVITIADNASTDASGEIAGRLAAELPHVRALRLPDKGRGRALRYAWMHSASPVLVYTDVDLSTDLRALLRWLRVVHQGQPLARLPFELRVR